MHCINVLNSFLANVSILYIIHDIDNLKKGLSNLHHSVIKLCLKSSALISHILKSSLLRNRIGFYQLNSEAITCK